jgi:tetratricopeptide (TPR) repeat protein
MRPGRLAGLAAMAVFALWAPLRAAPQNALQARALMEAGLAQERAGKHPEAAAAFTQALASTALAKPDRVRALYDRGVAFDALGKTKLAIADYAAALRLDRAFAPALNNRANAFRRLGRLSEAKRDYLAALNCPGALREYPYFGLGQIAESQGDNSSARDYYLKAVAMNPSFALAVTTLAALKPEPVAPPKPVMVAAAPVLKPPAQKPAVVAVAPVLPPPATKPAVVAVALKPQPVAPKPASSQPVSLTPASPPPAPPQAALHPAVAQSAPDPLLRKAILDGKTSKPVQVQLGAFASQETALAAWNRITAASGGLLAGFSPLTVEVDLPKKGHFWRLRTAVADKAAAQALCAKLTARGQACLLARD